MLTDERIQQLRNDGFDDVADRIAELEAEITRAVHGAVEMLNNQKSLIDELEDRLEKAQAALKQIVSGCNREIDRRFSCAQVVQVADLALQSISAPADAKG